MKAIYINDERTLNLLKGAVGSLGMQVVRKSLTGGEPIICDGQPITLSELKELVNLPKDVEEVDDGPVLSASERFVVGSALGSLVAAGVQVPKAMMVELTDALDLVMTPDERHTAIAELAQAFIADHT